jgi:coiled-coil domain-containing protein 130
MSSLAAAQADSFYFPPEYDGRKHGGLSKFNNPNYKGSNQWQQAGIVRMELPFDGWCLGLYWDILVFILYIIFFPPSS